MKNEPKVNREDAIEMLEKWLDAKKVSNAKRETLEAVEDEILDAICDGYLTLDETDEEDLKWIFDLKFPLSSVSRLTFAFRMNIGKLEVKLRKVASEDTQGRIKVYVAVLTDQPNGIIQALDTADSAIAASIASYFF